MKAPTRRGFLRVAAAAAVALRRSAADDAAALPSVCLCSQHLSKLHYSELGGILKAMGVDACDLTVRAGGHVLPEKAPADLVRAVESLRGEGVEVPMITTDITSANSPYARNVLGLAGQYLQVPFFQPGYWNWGSGAREARLEEVRRALNGLVAVGRAYGIAAGIHNRTGQVGELPSDAAQLLSGLEVRWVGYCFDPAHAAATGDWQAALRSAMPRLKMVVAQDFTWEGTGTGRSMKMCPLGQGMVDWRVFFGELAAARFTGPVSLRLDYNPRDEVSAIERDLAFLKKQVAAAYLRPSS